MTIEQNVANRLKTIARNAVEQARRTCGRLHPEWNEGENYLADWIFSGLVEEMSRTPGPEEGCSPLAPREPSSISDRLIASARAFHEEQLEAAE